MQKQVYQGMSHLLKLEVARHISLAYLHDVDLFEGCSDQLKDSVCVLLREVRLVW